jgi:serine/threonine protein kinase
MVTEFSLEMEGFAGVRRPERDRIARTRMKETTVDRASFGPYEILAPLGRGGMGEVYRAWDPRLQREVALKILRERFETDPDRLQRFIAEARAASALNHPNILAVFDAAVDGATPFIVSELIEGESLRSEVRRGPIPLKRLLDLTTQIADGLAEAHTAGIVHRDLKPENIMVTRAGRAKILDFGLAQPFGLPAPGGLPADLDGQTATDPGLLSGTVPYMSPEQARGAPTDSRSDQFSFGLIVYEMAAGRPAFRSDTPAETLEAIIGDEPTPLPALNRQAPLLLWWIIERCLAKNPDERYGVTADLHRDLRMLRDRLAEAVAREARSIRLDHTDRSVVRRAAQIVSGLALAASVAIIWRLLADPQPPDLSSLRFTPLATEAGFEGFPAWSPKDGQTIAYAAETDGVLQIFTRRQTSSTPVKLTSAAYDCKHPFWSPDGRKLYYISLAEESDGIWQVPAAGGTAQNVVRNASRGAISPDGKTLVFLRDEERADLVGTAALWLANADGTDQRRYERAPFGELRFVEAALWFSPDGTKLGVSGVPGTIGLPPERRGWQFWILPWPDGEPIRRFTAWSDPTPRVSSFTWMGDNHHVVIGIIPAGTPDSQLWFADVESERAWPLTPSPGSKYYPSASPVGDQIAFTYGDPDYDLVQVTLNGGAVRTLIGTSRNEADPVWSPRAGAYAYVTDRAGQDEIWLRSGQGPLGDRPLVTQQDFGDDRTIMLSSPSFSPDGQRLAYQRNASRPVWPLRIWYSAVAGGPPVPLLPEAHEGLQGAPTWSPDGQWLGFAEWNNKQWRLLKVRVGGTQEPVILRTDGVANATPHWSPAGDWITWENDQGFLIVSASDGRQEKLHIPGQWLVHTWSADGSLLYGIRETDDLRLSLITVDIRTGRERTLADLGPSLPVNNQMKGLSLGPDDRTLIASIARMRGDLWLLEGLRAPRGILDRLWNW